MSNLQYSIIFKQIDRFITGLKNMTIKFKEGRVTMSKDSSSKSMYKSFSDIYY